MSQWHFGRTATYLHYNLAVEGISLQKVDESYTTQTCPVCGRRKKTSSRNYKCTCGYREHRENSRSQKYLEQLQIREVPRTICRRAKVSTDCLR
ncbi:zinc ribbon domain-containing protein [Desulfosporosinus sp. SYSU MS00001]|uniref:zinc ribbon domain-containing protein n=1 Tax=Desulfosporosinus sp. SYSU MS00001 TaxID=3416284 RepID=UPI003CF18F8A